MFQPIKTYSIMTVGDSLDIASTGEIVINIEKSLLINIGNPK